MGGFKSSRGERDFSYQGELAFSVFPSIVTVIILCNLSLYSQHLDGLS